MRILRKILENFLTSGIKDSSDVIKIQRIRFLNSFILIGGLVLLVFGLIHTLLGNLAQGIFNLSFLIFAVFLIVYLRVTNNLKTGSFIILTATLIILSFYIFHGGFQKRGITWFYLYPGLVFFLKGKRKGIFWLMPLYLISFIALILNHFKLVKIPYNPLSVLLLLISLSIVSGIIYLYEKQREARERHIEKQNLELTRKNEQIRIELEEKKEAILKQETTLGHFSNVVQIMTSLIASSSSRLYEKAQETKTLSVMLAKKLLLDYHQVMDIEIASILKDMGMIGNIENILYSKKDLNPEEVIIVKSHINKSLEILKDIPAMENVKLIISQHHERYDGSGYPNKLSGDEISTGAKIIGLIDDFVDLTHDNRYQGLDKKKRILQILEREKGKKYDPEIMEIFINLVKEKNFISIVDQTDIVTKKSNGELSVEIPSDINLEAPVAAKIMDKVATAGIDSSEMFLINYCVREVIRNAIIHGNKYDKNKLVKISVILEEINENETELTVKVRDKGEGLDISKHKKFVSSREELFSIYDRLKSIKQSIAGQNADKLETIINDLNRFKNKNYFDFNAFMQFESPELTGGVGLLYVETTFDNVTYNKIIEQDKVVAFEVIMQKVLVKKR